MRFRPVAALLLLVVSFAAPLATAAPAHAAASTDGAKTFISKLADDAIRSLTGKDIPRAQRIANFRQLFEQSFAVGPIGRFVLGPNWRRATVEQKKQFLKLFEDLMVVSYVDKFARYSGQKLKVERAVREQEDNRFIVYTSLLQPGDGNAKPVEVLWRLGYRDDAYKVLDVLIEGTSMGLTYRNEFGSIIRNDGIDGLLTLLKKKTQDLASGQSQ